MIPESLESGDFSSVINLTEFTVEEGNKTFSSLDGVLFNADQTELLRYPVEVVKNSPRKAGPSRKGRPCVKV